MITVLTGAKKNIGDFLIAEKAKQVISRITGETDFLQIDRWLPFDDRLDAVNATKAVMICGGPAYSSEFYPKTLPLVSDLRNIRVPIIPVGLGLGGIHPDALPSFSFTRESLEAIRYIHSTCRVSGVRDRLTQEQLRKSGIENVVVSGCPVLYDFDSFGKPFVPPREIKRIVFTPPAKRPFFAQSLELAQQIRQRFPHAEIVASFHRGIAPDRYTTLKQAFYNYHLTRRLKKSGIVSVDTSYDLKRIEFYRECDLHIGYRVHAHVNFISFRKPSFLLQEDTRGVGMSDVLGLSENDANAHDGAAVKTVLASLDRERNQGYQSFGHIPATIDGLYQNMTQVLGEFRKT